MTESVEPTQKITAQHVELCLERARCSALSFSKKPDFDSRLQSINIIDSYYLAGRRDKVDIIPESRILTAYSKAQEAKLESK